jgi:hypothetical protein
MIVDESCIRQNRKNDMACSGVSRQRHCQKHRKNGVMGSRKLTRHHRPMHPTNTTHNLVKFFIIHWHIAPALFIMLQFSSRHHYGIHYLINPHYTHIIYVSCPHHFTYRRQYILRKTMAKSCYSSTKILAKIYFGSRFGLSLEKMDDRRGMANRKHGTVRASGGGCRSRVSIERMGWH